MFTRKHICGYACASCEKDLVNLYGKKVEYMPWGKLPFRDPSERIARVGQGFSKMLSIINPEQLTRYDQMRQTSTQDSIRRNQPNFFSEGASKDGSSPEKHGVNLPQTVTNGRSSVSDNNHFSGDGQVREGSDSARKVQTRIMTRRRKQ